MSVDPDRGNQGPLSCWTTLALAARQSRLREGRYLSGGPRLYIYMGVFSDQQDCDRDVAATCDVLERREHIEERTGL
jgi:hypothetical protein